MVNFSVVCDGEIFEQYVRNRIASMAAAGVDSNCAELITTNISLILLVMAEESADLEVVGTNHLREVIPPDKEVFTVLPGRLVPKCFVATGSPDKTRISRALGMWKNRRKCSGDLIVERLRSRVG